MQALSCSRLWVKIFSSISKPFGSVHELSDLKRKYWLQFAKLQNTSMPRVYEKEVEPKTIFL